jgi:endoglucanase
MLAGVLLFLVAAGGCKQGPWSLWSAYQAHFIDPQGRVVDPQGGGRTTSEGQAYALFFALANNDREQFDRVMRWTQSNLGSGSLATHLPGWLWGKSKDGDWKLLDTNPASDADCWMAYSLIEAGRLWKNPAYAVLGRQMLSQIARQEVTELPGFGLVVMPGPASSFVHNNAWMINPSYLPLFVFERFADVDPKGPWGAVSMNIPRLLRESARHGFIMDWVTYIPGDGFHPAAGPLALAPGQTAPAPVGSYDAIRVYLWAGMLDKTDQARSEMLGGLAGMGAYLGNHGAPPEKVSDQGLPLEQDGPVGFSAALVPYLRAVPDFSKAAAQQRVRMSGFLDPSTGLYGKDPAYYDQNLALFTTGYLDDRFRFGAQGELKVEWTR